MKIKFLGATGTVTGSKYLIEHNRKQYLVDCGLFQGLKELRLRNWAPPPINVNSLDGVILTHAHLDHSGYIPKLVKLGFKGKIYCTPPTRDLCKVLLPDSGHLQEEEARFANKHGYSKHHPALPLYTFQDAHDSLKYFKVIEYDKIFDLGDGMSVKFQNAGHILGSSFVTITDGSKKITFSGDLGREKDPILNPPELPDNPDYLVVESTYGNRSHDPIDPMDQLAEVITKTINRGGTVIVPSFAVGRTQSILFYVANLLKDGRIPNVPVYLNSPMAINATGLYCDHRPSHALTPQQCHEMCNVATYVNSVEESKRLNNQPFPKIIISASGMATGGRVIHHIKAYGPDPNNTILFVGYQAAGTRGEKIVGGAESVKIHGSQIPIRAEIVNMHNLSAHADKDELLLWVKGFSGSLRKVFVTHGEPTAAAEFEKSLSEQLKLDVTIPEYLNDYSL